MKTNKNNASTSEDNMVSHIIGRFFPYWPLFLMLVIITVLGALIYLRYAAPMYDITATMLIKDDKKGANDARIMESFNIISPNDIVENEIEILQSKAVMNEVVLKLDLYAPIFSEGRVNSIPAYTSSPYKVQVKFPMLLDTITSIPDKKIYFTFNTDKTDVIIENKKYLLNEWINTAYGTLKFVKNPNFIKAGDKTFYFKLVPPVQVTSQLMSNLNITQPNKLSSIVKLVLKDESQKRGEDILNELINTYNIASIDDKNEFSTKTLSIVNDKLEDVQHQVDSIQKLINQYKQSNGIVNLSEQSTLYLQNVGSNDEKISDISMQLSVLDEVEKYVESNTQGDGVIPSTLGINDPLLTSLLQKLYDLEINYQRMKMTATENNPSMISLSNDISKTKTNILENIRVQRISLNTSRNDLSGTINKYSSSLNNIPDKEKDLITISRQLSALNSTYDFLLQKKQEASLTNASTLANSRTVDKAQSSLKPTSPNKMAVLVAAIALAFVIGIFWVLCKEDFNSKVLFRSEISRYTDIPIIAEISDFKKISKKIPEKNKEIIVNEQFRQLMAGMRLYSKKNPKKKILVTSSISGEGKSFISSTLALTLAESGKKIILLDFDFRNPAVTDRNKLNEKGGIGDYLEGRLAVFEILQRRQHENLFVAGVGTLDLKNVGAFVLSDKVKDLFSYLEDMFDFIIIDTAPVGPVSDAFILSDYVDCTLFVVKHDYTPKSIISTFNENDKIREMRNIEIVFNGIKPRGFAQHSNGYGYGYGTAAYDYAYTQRQARQSHVN